MATPPPHPERTSISGPMIHLDASHLEGGGQSPRLALCLSSLTRTPVHITNIRANRSATNPSKNRSPGKPSKNSNSRPNTVKPGKNGGLKESHLAALNFLAEACGADVTGAEVGSREVLFIPGARRALPPPTNEGKRNARERPEQAKIELKNPGSVFLIFQALHPYLVLTQHSACPPPTASPTTHDFNGNKDPILPDRTINSSIAPSSDTPSPVFSLALIGGTNVSASISYDYMQQVFLPISRKIGLPDIAISCVKRGWAGPASERGEVKIDVNLPPPSFVLPAFQIQDRGDITKVVISVIGDSAHIRDMMFQRITERLLERLGQEMDVEVLVNEPSGHASRLFVMAVAHTSEGWRIASDYLHPSPPPHTNRGAHARTTGSKKESEMIDTAVNAVVSGLIRELEGGACVDSHMQDQLVVFQALASGRSVVKAKESVDEVGGTLHARTARWVCEQILGKSVRFEGNGGCMGIGWNDKQMSEPIDEIGEGVQELEI